MKRSRDATRHGKRIVQKENAREQPGVCDRSPRV